MLRSFKTLENDTLTATDGEIGKLKDFYFDDVDWVVRYVVVETGTWLASRQVLVSPISVRHPDWEARTLPVSITMDQVRNSPAIDTHQPVSRQNEEQFLGYYGYPTYWGGAGLWGEGLYPYAMEPAYVALGVSRLQRERELEAFLRDEKARHRHDDPHLRSCLGITGYDIHATDGPLGHVAGFLLDDETWSIRYLVVETGHWWHGHQVLVAPPWIQGMQWSDRSVQVDLSRAAIQEAPAYDAAQGWSREQELSLYEHHRRSGYWADRALLETEL